MSAYNSCSVGGYGVNGSTAASQAVGSSSNLDSRSSSSYKNKNRLMDWRFFYLAKNAFTRLPKIKVNVYYFAKQYPTPRVL